MPSKTHNKAILAIIAANIIWGVASPIFKLSLQNISPFTLAFLRFFAAAYLLFPFAVNDLWIDKKDYLKIFLISIFGITINISFFFWGLQSAPSINAPIIATSAPIFIYIFSIVILKEKPKFKILAGLLVSLIGVLLIISKPLFEKGISGEILGNLFFLLATLGAVGHTIVSKEILPKYRASVVTFWSFLIGSFTFLPFFIYEMMTVNPFHNLDYRGITGLIFGILFSSAAAYYLFEWGVKKVDGQEIGVFAYVDPVAAILIAIPLLHETVTPIFLIGSIFVFAGIFIAENRLHWHPFHKFRK